MKEPLSSSSERQGLTIGLYIGRKVRSVLASVPRLKDFSLLSQTFDFSHADDRRRRPAGGWPLFIRVLEIAIIDHRPLTLLFALFIRIRPPHPSLNP